MAYQWLLHWWEHLPREQHYTLTSGSPKILRLGLVYLIKDLQRAWAAFSADVRGSDDLREKLERAHAELGSYTVRLADIPD